MSHTRVRQQQEKVQEQERLRLEAEKTAQAEQKAKEDAVVREGAKLMQVGAMMNTSLTAFMQMLALSPYGFAP